MPNPATYRLLFNFLLFQAGWLVCIFSPNAIAIGYTAVAVLLHVYFWGKQKDLLFSISLVSFGLASDLLLIHSGLISFNRMVFDVYPPWLFCLWLLFSLTINHSLAWALDHPLLLSILCAVAGPFSYYAGAHLGAGHIHNTPVFFALSGALWLALSILLIFLDKTCRNEKHNT